jgi:divalent metal cation (Fe/Co/Zn/Cd) transporter
MAQHLKMENEHAPQTYFQSRQSQLRLGIWIELIALLWMVIEASIAIVAGLSSHSVSLEGFGIDSIIELVAGSILLWRLLVEQRGGSSNLVSKAERRASWITVISLFGLALYIVIDSTISLLTQSHPQVSQWGIGVAIAAAIIMPLLWQGKIHVAKRIGSSALKTDAMCSVTCAYMSFTLLVGLILNTFFGFWWADTLASLALVYFIVREGLEALHEARIGEFCTCGTDECDS